MHSQIPIQRINRDPNCRNLPQKRPQIMADGLLEIYLLGIPL